MLNIVDHMMFQREAERIILGCFGFERRKAPTLAMISSSHDNALMPKTRIMYIENKSESLNGPARIGRVTFSKTGKSIRYGGRTFQSLNGSGFKANYVDIDTGEEFWISGPRKHGRDRLYPESSQPVEIDEDIEEDYWHNIRGVKLPE